MEKTKIIDMINRAKRELNLVDNFHYRISIKDIPDIRNFFQGNPTGLEVEIASISQLRKYELHIEYYAILKSEK